MLKDEHLVCRICIGWQTMAETLGRRQPASRAICHRMRALVELQMTTGDFVHAVLMSWDLPSCSCFKCRITQSGLQISDRVSH